MEHRTLRRAALVLVAALALGPVAAFAAGSASSDGFGLRTKQGVSGQVYAWQAGGC